MTSMEIRQLEAIKNQLLNELERFRNVVRHSGKPADELGTEAIGILLHTLPRIIQGPTALDRLRDIYIGIRTGQLAVPVDVDLIRDLLNKTEMIPANSPRHPNQ